MDDPMDDPMTWERFAEYASRIVLTVLFVVAVYLIYVRGI